MSTPVIPRRVKVKMTHTREQDNKQVWTGSYSRIGAPRRGNPLKPVEFVLHIPKWRVPASCPALELVICHPEYLVSGIQEILGTEVPPRENSFQALLTSFKVAEGEVQEKPDLASRAIVTEVRKREAGKDTIKYAAKDDAQVAEIGDSTLPKGITFQEAEELVFIVKWMQAPA